MQYLLTINSLFNFTYRELEVLALIFDYLYDVKHNGLKEINSIDLRKQIMRKTNINKNNLSKYLKVFEDAGAIIRDPITNIPSISSIIEPVLLDDSIDISFKITVNNG